MRTLVSLGLMLMLNLLPLCAQVSLSVGEALAKDMIQIAMKGHGGHMGKKLHIWVKNLTAETLTITVPPGQQVASTDTNLQDLIITAPALVKVPPREVVATDLFTMCTQSYNMSPHRGEVYRINGMAEGALLELAQKIADNGYQNSTAQCAVWATVNRRGHRNVFGEDTEMVRDLATTVSQAVGIDMREFDFTPRRHQITNINTSFEALLTRDLANANLRVYTPDGVMMHEYFAGRSVERGFHQWKVGINHTLDSTAELRMILRDGEEVIAARRVLREDSVMPLHRYHSEVILDYETSDDQRGEIGVYDESGTLYFLLQEDRLLRTGAHRTRSIVGKDLPQDRDYFVQMRAGERILASQLLDPDAPEPTRMAKRQINGSVNWDIPALIEDGSLGIYYEDGRLKRMLYEIPRLKAGRRRFSYRFEHVQGLGAVFYLRLMNAAGEIVLEEEIRDE